MNENKDVTSLKHANDIAKLAIECDGIVPMTRLMLKALREAYNTGLDVGSTSELPAAMIINGGKYIRVE
jgi:hypothetical protein